MATRTAPLPVRLDPLDRRLLAALDRDPTAGYTRLGEKLQASPRTVAGRLARLRSHGVVRVVGRTLPGFGGRDSWLVRARVDPGTARQVAAALARDEHSRWVRLTRDRSELVAGLVTASPDDDVLVALPADRRVREVRSYELLEVWSRQDDAVTRPARELDPVDRRLLQVLAEDGRTPVRDLAARIGVDASTASRRRRRLVAERVLFFEADIHPAALADGGDAMLWLRTAPGGVRALGRWLRRRPECRFAAATSGDVSVVAHMTLPDPTALLDFLDGPLAERGAQGVDVVRLGQVFKRHAP